MQGQDRDRGRETARAGVLVGGTQGDGVGAGGGEDVADVDAAAVAGGAVNGLQRRAVAPVDGVGEAGGLIDRRRVGGGGGVGEDLGGQPGGVPAERRRRRHV